MKTALQIVMQILVTVIQDDVIEDDSAEGEQLYGNLDARVRMDRLLFSPGVSDWTQDEPLSKSVLRMRLAPRESISRPARILTLAGPAPWIDVWAARA